MDDAFNFPATAQSDLAALTSDIVAAYVSHNSTQLADLPKLIASVHGALSGLGAPGTAAEPVVEKLSAAEVRKSIRPDGLVSLIDGRSYKTLKRHLAKAGLTPADYRAKYGLPSDYPMVAASYAAQRSELAKKLGLGQVRRNRAAAKVADTVEVRAEPASARKLGRPRKPKPTEAA